MNKYIIILLLLLTSCSETRKFKVGDCVQYYKKERWESNSIQKIEEIGKLSYKTTYWNNTSQSWLSEENLEFSVEKYYEKVECPKPCEKDSCEYN